MRPKTEIRMVHLRAELKMHAAKLRDHFSIIAAAEQPEGVLDFDLVDSILERMDHSRDTLCRIMETA